MPAQLIDGKILAEKIKEDVKAKVATMENKPGLAALMIGENSASKIYIKLKEKACLETGINFHSYFFSADTKDEKIIEAIEFLNKDPEVSGILVQLPLPTKFATDKIIKTINPLKDVDGFHPQTKFISPNVLGIIELIKSTKVNLKNKRVTILSNSEIFAQPFKKILPDSNVQHLNPQSIIHNLSSIILDSDVLIVAIGKPHYIKPDMIKKDTILIDVGINKINGQTVGDIDPSCDRVASWRSPVPGGVGPMTVAMLLKNLIS